MIGTLRYRLKSAMEVFLGKKRAVDIRSNSPLSASGDKTAIRDWTNQFSVEFFFCEFGEERVNAGGNTFSQVHRLDPTFSSLKKYFPTAKFIVYTDSDRDFPGAEVRRVTSPIPDKSHPRYLYRTADYFKFKCLVDSDADFRCVMDTDMYICNENILHLLPLTQKFGYCVPYNVRNLLKHDMDISIDTQTITDESGGFGHSYNQSPMTLWKGSEAGTSFYRKCSEIMIKEPSRASLVMWKAAWETGIYPYILPSQFCVCTGQEGIGNEVLLHVGHKSVADHYKIDL